MTVCAKCGGSLVTEKPLPYDDGPFEEGEHIPPLDTDEYDVDEAFGYVICPSCGGERPLTIRDWYEPPKKL